MTKTKLLTALLILIVLISKAQTVTSSNFDGINGTWQGTLTYLDYQDDVKTSTLKCGMEASWKKNKGTLTLLFTEPDGRVIKNKTKIALKQKGKKFVFDGTKYNVLDFTTNKDGWKFIIGVDGSDNYKKSEIKMTICYSKNQLTISKEVKYEGTDSFFERNRYAFTRK